MFAARTRRRGRSNSPKIDLTVRLIAERLPAGAAMIVTADHGMVQVDSPVDFDRRPELQAGVRALGGEPRARHVYAEPGAADDVAAAWRELLGVDFTVATRAEVVGLGWFGPRVTSRVAPRIGDVVVVANTDGAVIRSGAEPLQSHLVRSSRLAHQGGDAGAAVHDSLISPEGRARREPA